MPAAAFLAQHDIVVNCVLQDTDAPLMFVSENELDAFAPGSLLVDVSCDLGMGFDFARPTSFEEPMLTFGDGVAYYGVDHSPSYLWNSATWGISEALIPFVRTVMDGPAAWDADATISRAIEIRDGVVANPKILSLPGTLRRAPATTGSDPGVDLERVGCGRSGWGASARRLMPRSIWRSMTKPIGSTRCHITFMESG